MTTLQHSATIVWEGSVARGGGAVNGATGALGPLAVDLPTRIGDATGKTTPEELLVAAHISCFTMSLGSVLARAKTPPERLEVSGTVTLDMSGERPEIPTIDIVAAGSVPGIDAAAFQAAVKQAEQLCLISRILIQGNVKVEATGHLS